MNEKETTEEAFDMDFNVRDYFTSDMDRRIKDLSAGEMESLLKELSDSPYWIAILKYNQERLRYAQDGLITGDPFKDPTSIARNQGVMMGLSDMQNAVILLTMQAQKREAESAEKEKKADT